MKQRLLALAALVAAAGAGTVLFVNWEDGTIAGRIEDVGSWELIDRANVTMSACNSAQCTTAQNILTDAGSSCIPRFADGDFRVSARMRACFADAGVTMGAQKYQRLRLIALRCAGTDGGFAFGVPMDDAGCPIFAVAVTTPRCVRAPLDGGANCRRLLPDGGTVFFGTGNVFPAAEAAGSNCDACGCTVIYGDDPSVDL